VVPQNRLIPLDILRAIAVLLVLGRHAIPFPEDAAAPMRAFYVLWSRAGWIGVDLFFVLSGFLVSGLLFREYIRYGKMDVVRFLIRRGFKIYPAFYVCILATYLVHAPPLAQMLSEVFFVQNYFRPIWPHTWTLAVEEHFYLALPLLLLALKSGNRGGKDPFARLPAIIIAAAAAMLALRIGLAVSQPYRPHVHVYPSHLRFDSLLFGVLLAYFYNFHHEALSGFVERHRRWLYALGTAAVLPAFVFPLEQSRFMTSFGFTLLYLGFGSLMIACVVCAHTRFESPSRWLRFWAYLGSHSYSVYLWHYPIWLWTVRLVFPVFGINLHYAVECLLYVVVCFAWGVAVGKLVEFPMLGLRDRLFPARSRPVSPPS
jgi:peptidoglycan/LPS O-acetylase OafA/YrhL